MTQLRFVLGVDLDGVCAEFYANVFSLQLADRRQNDPNYHLTEGKVTLSIMPWSIDMFAGMAIKRPGPDHLGIRVKDLAAFTEEERRIGEKNTFIASRKLGGSKESQVRKALIESSVIGDYVTADPDGNWLDIRQG